jgi:flagellar FliL protein
MPSLADFEAPPEAEAPPPAAAAGTGTSLVSFIVAMVVLTGLSVGAGGMFGLQVLSRVGHQSGAKAPAETRKGRFSDKATLHALSPIITNLASPERTWIRLEASIVIDAEGRTRRRCRAAITEDTVAYLRTLSLPLIRAPAGCCICARTSTARARAQRRQGARHHRAHADRGVRAP